MVLGLLKFLTELLQLLLKLVELLLPLRHFCIVFVII